MHHQTFWIPCVIVFDNAKSARALPAHALAVVPEVIIKVSVALIAEIVSCRAVSADFAFPPSACVNYNALVDSVDFVTVIADKTAVLTENFALWRHVSVIWIDNTATAGTDLDFV